jgi:hypothetical protein
MTMAVGPLLNEVNVLEFLSTYCSAAFEKGGGGLSLYKMAFLVVPSDSCHL